MLRSAALLCSLFSLAACATAPTPTPALPAPSGTVVQTPISGPGGVAVGLLTVAEGPRGVLLRVNTLPGALTPGWHGLHIHELGDCSSEGFVSSGGHVGHGERAQHGLLNPNGPETGDLPNLLVPGPQHGAAVELYLDGAALHAVRGRTNLADGDGSALVIHAGPDDHTSQPIGGAGIRVACAVIPPAGRADAPQARSRRRRRA